MVPGILLHFFSHSALPVVTFGTKGSVQERIALHRLRLLNKSCTGVAGDWLANDVDAVLSRSTAPHTRKPNLNCDVHLIVVNLRGELLFQIK